MHVRNKIYHRKQLKTETDKMFILEKSLIKAFFHGRIIILQVGLTGNRLVT